MAGDARAVAAKRAVKSRATTMQHHLFVCIEDDCGNGAKRAKQIRRRVAEANARDAVTVTEAACLGICESGPICVVYPEGTWYHSVNQKLARRIVDEHLLGGTPVADATFLTNRLGPDEV